MAQRPEDFDPANINSRVAESIPIPTTVTAGAWDDGTDGPKNPNASQVIAKPWPKWIRILLTVGTSLTILILFGWGASEQDARQQAEKQLGSQTDGAASVREISEQLNQAKQQVAEQQKSFQEQLEKQEAQTAEAVSDKFSLQISDWLAGNCADNSQCFRLQLNNPCSEKAVVAVDFRLPVEISKTEKWATTGWYEVSPQETTNPLGQVVSKNPLVYLYAKYSPSQKIWDGTGKTDSVGKTVVGNPFFIIAGDQPLGRNKESISMLKQPLEGGYGVKTVSLVCP